MQLISKGASYWQYMNGYVQVVQKSSPEFAYTYSSNLDTPKLLQSDPILHVGDFLPKRLLSFPLYYNFLQLQVLFLGPPSMQRDSGAHRLRFGIYPFACERRLVEKCLDS